jgi:shikimate 5-dehydrogenase
MQGSTTQAATDEQPLTYQVDSARTALPAATILTLYFIGVATARSSIRTVFPAWARVLGLGDVHLVGIDMPLHADPAAYRHVVDFIKHDPFSLGALVTTHKLDLYAAARDQFDVIDPHALLLGETSCLSKRNGQLVCHAKDPISSGLAIDAFVPAGHWARSQGEVVCLGAGGSAIAISWFVTQPGRGVDRPSRVVITNRSTARLDALRAKFATAAIDVPIEYVHAPNPEDNDRVVAAARPGSLIVNATGLGKDAPGSPVSDAVTWPKDGYAWDLNYRGDLRFLDQARSGATRYNLHVEDGWVYFLHGWTQVIAEVFSIAIPTSGPVFDELAAIAVDTRG